MADLVDVSEIRKICGGCEHWKPFVCFRQGKKNKSRTEKACKHYVEKVKK